MVQYTTLFVAAAICSTAMPALADSIITPRLNRRATRMLFRRAGNLPVAGNRVIPPKEYVPYKAQQDFLERINQNVAALAVAGQKRKEKPEAAKKQVKDPAKRKDAERDGSEEADDSEPKRQKQPRDVSMEELLARMLEREFYDDLD